MSKSETTVDRPQTIVEFLQYHHGWSEHELGAWQDATQAMAAHASGTQPHRRSGATMKHEPATPETTVTWTPSHALQIGETVQMERIIRPKWWQFWRKPERRMITYQVTEVANGR